MQLGFVEVTGPLVDGAATAEAMRYLVIDELTQLASEDSLDQATYVLGMRYPTTVPSRDGCLSAPGWRSQLS